jgi:antitoxin (DNA-binding transcriptional repressor) of toxin-antitoxin stability system
MKHIAITEFRKELEAYVRGIESGESFLITRYGRPVAEARRHQPDGDLRPA